MSSDNSRRPPEVLLPWAGTWAKLIADAIEVGFSNAERNDPVIETALDGLSGRTSERVMSGETATPRAWDGVIGHLAVLLRRPRWMPTADVSVTACETLLREWFSGLERLAARTSLNPNVDATVTRAAWRLVMIDAALRLGLLSRAEPKAPVDFRPWKPKEGLGRVVRDLSKQFRPNLKREEIILKLRISSPPVWDRLLRGEIPKTAWFDFDAFARLWGGPEAQKPVLASALRRAFVARRFDEQLRKVVNVGNADPRFWDDCWREFARVYRVATSQASVDVAGGTPMSLSAAWTVASADAGGFWTHTFKALPGDWLFHLETVANAAQVAFESRSGIEVTDQRIVDLLNRYEATPFSTIHQRALAARGTAEAITQLERLPPTLGRELSLGREHMSQGNQVEARRHFERAHRLAPDDWEVVLDLAWFESCHGDPVRVCALLAAPSFSGEREYPLVMGEALFRLGRHEEALAFFRNSISRQHAIGHCYGRAAQCLLLLGRDEEARALGKTCSRLTGTDPLTTV